MITARLFVCGPEKRVFLCEGLHSPGEGSSFGGQEFPCPPRGVQRHPASELVSTRFTWRKVVVLVFESIGSEGQGALPLLLLLLSSLYLCSKGDFVCVCVLQLLPG